MTELELTTRQHDTECHRVLVSDIDGTLLKEAEPTPGLETLRVLLQQDARRTRLVYATGRTRESVISLVEQEILPVPDAVAPLVGTEIWFPPFDEPDPEFARYIDEGWRREAIMEVASSMGHLELQPEKFQTRHKLSYFVESPQVVRDLEKRLDEMGLRYRLIHSGGRFLDFIPRRAGKRAAAEYIIRKWSARDASILAAGDSLNDRDLLDAPHFNAVVVGNSDDGLDDAVDEEGTHVADLPHAAGVLEGAEVFDFWKDGKPT